VLIGRQAERARIERLLDDARHGRSGVLVLRGEPGIGKTALVGYARDRAEAMTVVTATGIEAEAEVEYSGLLELTRPLLPLLAEIPDHQADALRDALGLVPPSARDPFSVGAALLSLVAAAAEERPTLVLVDDAHWVDNASADALRFAARRVFADRVAFVFALRGQEGLSFDTGGLETLELTGLALGDAGALLERSGVDGLPDAVLEEVYEAAGGNPLALTELGGLLTPEELAAWRLRAEPLPVGAAVQQAFVRRALDLPPETRAALVVAAAASTPAADVIGAALTAVGSTLSSLEPAEDAGLVSLSAGSVTFRHPLVRAAVHHSAPMSERRAAHQALADALERAGQEERRAWHLSAAALGTDESIAASLDAVAARSRERGAHAAAAAALEQAARLSPEDARRLDRLVRAAEAAWQGGSSSSALALLQEALSLSDDDDRRSRILALHGRIEGEVGEQGWSRDLLLEAASLVADSDPLTAAPILLSATTPLYFGGDVAGSLATAERARAIVPRDGGPLDTRADVVLGWALSHAGRGDEAEPALARALSRLLADPSPTQPMLQNARLVLDILERVSEAQQLWPSLESMARPDGPVALLGALEQETRFLVRAGEWRRAVASGEEALAIARALGHEVDSTRVDVLLAVVGAARGDEVRCGERLERAATAARDHGLETLAATVGVVRGLLELGLGRLDDAAEILERVARRSEEMGLFARDVTPEPDLVEALAGLGRVDEAAEWLAAYAGRAARASPRWAAALVARGRGMLAADDGFETYFLDALGLHEAVPDRFQKARTLLAFGERLRRAKRRRDARERLRQALVLFEQLEATPWIMRTRRELRATGEKLGRRAAQSGEELTPQELQVALQVAEGKTNKEVGAALFLSPKTVEFHLARVYRKLNMSSRAELIRHFAEHKATAALVV
jgi:DNA-binding CsgD family transcriptional regulator